ncbi:MAG TPA: MBL fold metallo-hydrolase [Xanthobacteraceae bacterium]|nr:MBL fold metallo-hydrolase [Xanthobacteraceae bacterium]
MLSRRSFGLAALATTLAPAAPSFLLPAAAKAPFATDTAPGYYRLKVGAYQVTVLNDGFINLEAKIFSGDPAGAGALLERSFLPKDAVKTSVNEWVINTGDKLVLIDTGTANVFGPNLGHLAANLRAAGIAPEAVDMVVMTHLHPDHAAGLSADGKPAFPNATLHVADAEYAFWTSETIAGQAPDGAKPMFTIARNATKPYADAGRLVPFKDGDQILPGINVLAAPGHTVGHSMVRVSSQGSDLLIWGDIVHNAAMQFPEPDRALAFDTDQALAIVSRKKVFDMAATDRLLVAGAHLPFPGIGRVAKEGNAYRYVPRPSSDDA